MNSLDELMRQKAFRERTEILSGDHTGVLEIAAHVSGFLNTRGGSVILRGGLAATEDEMHREISERISPSPLFSISEDTYRNEPVSVIEVPEGKDGPFVCDGTIFLRRGSQTLKANAADLQELLQSRASEAERWERRACTGLSNDDLARNEIDRTIQRMTGAGHGEWADNDISEILHHLGQVRHDGSFTNAANICFSELPAIRHPQARLRAFAFPSETSDEFLDHDDLQAPISMLIDRARQFIARNVQQSGSFSLDDLERTDQSVYPDFAIREAIVNALAHRDYANPSGGVTIKVFPSRLEIWNSGQLPDGWQTKRLTAGHPSIPNNPDIAHFLYVRGFMERIGRGTLKILEACREARLPEPKWDTEDGVTLTFRTRVSMDAIEGELNHRQRDLLEHLDRGESIALGEYHREIAADVGERQARRDLAELEELGLLAREGSGRGTRYMRP